MAATTKHTVFISHAHADNDQCDAYANGLKTLGLDVWYDRTSMQASNLISDEIGKELKSRTALIILLTPNAVRSGWVMIEWQTFLNYWTKEQYKRIIVPVILSDCDVPPLLTPFKRVELSLMTQQEAIDTIARTLGVEPPPRRTYAVGRPLPAALPQNSDPRPHPAPWWRRRHPTSSPTSTQESGWSDYGVPDYGVPDYGVDELTKALQAVVDWLTFTEEKWRAVNDSQLGWKPLRGRWNGWDDIYKDVYPPQMLDTDDPIDDPMARRYEASKSKGSAASSVAGMLHDLDSLRSMLLKWQDGGSLPPSSGQAPAQPPARTGKRPAIRNPMIVDVDDDW